MGIAEALVVSALILVFGPLVLGALVLGVGLGIALLIELFK